MSTFVDDVGIELSKLKETYAAQSNKFIDTMAELNAEVNERNIELWDHFNKANTVQNQHDLTLL